MKAVLFPFCIAGLMLICLLSFFLSKVDKHIRRLDTDLARFEADLKEKQIESTDYDSTSSKGNKSKLNTLRVAPSASTHNVLIYITIIITINNFV